jgi:hypothetical protein
MLTEEEFMNKIAQIQGASIEGDMVHGIRLLTAKERDERSNNAEVIKKVICICCGADERECSSKCALMHNRLHKRLAAMIPPGTKLAKE